MSIMSDEFKQDLKSFVDAWEITHQHPPLDATSVAIGLAFMNNDFDCSDDEKLTELILEVDQLLRG